MSVFFYLVDFTYLSTEKPTQGYVKHFTSVLNGVGSEAGPICVLSTVAKSRILGLDCLGPHPARTC